VQTLLKTQNLLGNHSKIQLLCDIERQSVAAWLLYVDVNREYICKNLDASTWLQLSANPSAISLASTSEWRSTPLDSEDNKRPSAYIK